MIGDQQITLKFSVILVQHVNFH